MTEDRAVLLLAVLREHFGPDAELRRGDMTTSKYRPQLVADGHVPTIAELGYDTPTWGVHCYACSRTAEDYVWPCREGVVYDMPAELVAATELDQLRAQRDALLSWAAGNLGNSLIHKRIRECFGLPVDALTMMSPEVHALATPTAVACTGQQDTATCGYGECGAPVTLDWLCEKHQLEPHLLERHRDGGMAHSPTCWCQPTPAAVPPAADKADGSKA